MGHSSGLHNQTAGSVRRATIIGGSAIGASWAALFAANDVRVILYDPDPEAPGRTMALIESAMPALAKLGYATSGLTQRILFESDLAAAVTETDLVQECGPERVDFKRPIWAGVEAAAPTHALLLSSSSSIPASTQNTCMADRTRLLVGHPFDRPHLIPLVEVVPSATTDPAIVTRALAFYRGIGKVALELKQEIRGFIADRLRAALFRECMYLLRENVATMRDIDTVVTSSLGIGLAATGPFMTCHIGGGVGGMAHFIQQFGKGRMEKLWSTFGDIRFDDEMCRLLIEQAEAFYSDASIATLDAIRDEKQAAIVNALDGNRERAAA